MRSWKRNALVMGLCGSLLLLTVFSVWLAGCAANEPFDPESLENSPPTARLMVSPQEEGADLNHTSYFDRTFNWSGSDRDGWVMEYYISIRTDGDNPAAWDTTTTTDTTMTFTPDPTTGEASATFLLACVDNRGAFSDTVVQYVPMQNFPPVIAFQSDYEPFKNMQREFVYEGEAVVDTIYWNWGPSAFRFDVYDLDGIESMDEFYRYTMAEGDPELTWDIDDPDADVELGWIRAPFGEGTESYQFEVYVQGLEAGQRTMQVSVMDEAGGDQRFRYSWEVREPKGPVLYIPDNSSTSGKELYYGLMDQTYGEDGWDEYQFVYGYPDRDFILLESLRMFEAVVWTDGGSTSNIMSTATSRDGPLQLYTQPDDGSEPGKLLLVSRNVCGEGSLGPSAVFIGGVLGINAAESSPVEAIYSFAGHEAQAQDGGSYLPGIFGADDYGQGRGMSPLAGTDILYKMEYCLRCYGTARPPFDPVVGIRRPLRETQAAADVVCFSVQLEYFDHTQVKNALQEVLTQEMGVVAP